MKKLIFVFAFLMSLSTVFSQAEMLKSGNPTISPLSKGNFFLEGASRLDFMAKNYKFQDSDERKISIIDLNFQPRAGYYFIKNLVTGIFIDLTWSNQKDTQDTLEYRSNSTSITIGPFARYYLPVSGKLVPFIDGQVGFGFSNSRYKSSTDGVIFKSTGDLFTLRAGGGATYFFNDKVGADLFLGYQYNSNKFHYKDGSGNDINDDTKSIQNAFILQLGIVVILGC